MSQICYNIVNLLRNEDLHIREIAKKLSTNQMTISRRIKDLQNENVVDCRTQGRNIVCFIKDSIEAQDYLMMTEHSKVLQSIERYPRLRKIIFEIREEKKIKMALIFGSYAKDMVTKNSDIDLFIETNNKKIKKEIGMIDSRLSVKIGKFNKETSLGKEIIRHHIIIKGVERFYGLIHR